MYYTLLQLPVTAKWDTTGADALLDPTHGVRLAAAVTPTASLAGRQSEFAIILVTGSTYLNLGAPSRSVLALRATAGTVQGASTFAIPPEQRLYAGGTGTVRGYRYQSVGPQFADNRPVGGTAQAWVRATTRPSGRSGSTSRCRSPERTATTRSSCTWGWGRHSDAPGT